MSPDNVLPMSPDDSVTYVPDRFTRVYLFVGFPVCQSATISFNPSMISASSSAETCPMRFPILSVDKVLI